MTATVLVLTPLILAVAAARWPVEHALGFRTEIAPQFGVTTPFTGALVLTVSNQGFLRGQFRSDSIRPDPLYGRTVPVTGAISGNNGIQLQIGGAFNPISIVGTYSNDSITGNVTRGIRARGIWRFHATRVHLRNPPQNT
ncbi:MAG: hypothetical protein JO165_00030 [Candidatus Eremiobacteraeota bacterium]|nr:hypothetical protein [Candidatus Eremiobacteraeota bacterium]